MRKLETPGMQVQGDRLVAHVVNDVTCSRYTLTILAPLLETHFK